MTKNKERTFISCPELSQAGKAAHDVGRTLFQDINKRDIKLFDLPPHKRIFLFIMTRAIKTFAAIEVLCRRGYGQDVSALIRSLLENLITIQYIIYDPQNADEKARRFVEYKWVIFKRSIAEEELSLRRASGKIKQEFSEKKEMVLMHVNDFKKKYRVTSDRALVTWSGKTVKDMARIVNRELHQEYESMFRQCSRFSHPTILGDKEYIIQGHKTLTFAPGPSSLGVELNYLVAIKYFIQYLELVNGLFILGHEQPLGRLRQNFQNAQDCLNKKFLPSSDTSKKAETHLKEVKIHFQY
ncbi:MAG: DUF5677 domain-containing protein [Candidatus Omnitrophota bacterium]|jgi:hypothetical protein